MCSFEEVFSPDCNPQGKKRHLGKFKDGVSAARRHDEEAIKVLGEKAYPILNFQPGCTGHLTSTGAGNQLPELPAPNGPLPPGNADASSPLTSKTRLTSSPVANTAFGPRVQVKKQPAAFPGPEVSVSLCHLHLHLLKLTHGFVSLSCTAGC